MKRAICRQPSSSMARCELTHLDREVIDLGRVEREHRGYLLLLESLGVSVDLLPALDSFPDAVFVEDTAIVLDEVAVLSRPGAASRRGEVPSIAEALTPYRECLQLAGAGSFDGGDVLRLGKTIYVGRSSRSNQAGIEELAALLEPFGYRVQGVEVKACLHLKSAACALDDSTVLLKEDWVDSKLFAGVRVITTDPDEVGAANVVSLGEDLIYAAGSPRTSQKLSALGLRVHELEYGELAKAEGAVTCCSLLFED